MLEFERPVALSVKPLMNGKLLPVQYHRKPVGIELYGDFASHQAVGNGVAVAFDAYRRPFVDGIFHGLEASDVSGPGAHCAKVGADSELFLGGAAERDLGVHLPAYRVEMCLGVGQRRIMAGQRKGLAAHIFPRPFHMSLLPPGTRVAEAVVEHVVGRQKVQSLGRGLLIGAHELLDSHTHIVIDHSAWNTLYLTEEIAVRLHEGQRVLTRKQPRPAQIAMAGGEHGQIKFTEHAPYGDLDLAPVELTLLSGSIGLPDIGFCVARPSRLLFVGDISADGLVAYLNSLTRQNLPDVDLFKLLLAHPLTTPLGVKLQIPVYLSRDGPGQLAGLAATAVVGRLKRQQVVQSLVVRCLLRGLLLGQHFVDGCAGYAELAGNPAAAVVAAPIKMYDCLYVYHG